MVSNRKIFVVVNPNSANRRTGREWPQISRALQEAIGDFEALQTRAPGEATRITREALKSGFQMIVSVGGDGTHNEVVNGFFSLEGGKPAPVNPGSRSRGRDQGHGGRFPEDPQDREGYRAGYPGAEKRAGPPD